MTGLIYFGPLQILLEFLPRVVDESNIFLPSLLCLCQWFSNFSGYEHHLESLVDHRLLRLTCRVSNLVDLRLEFVNLLNMHL